MGTMDHGGQDEIGAPPPLPSERTDLPPPAASKSPTAWKTGHLVATGLVALLVGIGVGSAGNEPADADLAAEPAPTETVTVTETAEPEPAETVTVTETVTEQEPSPAPTSEAEVFARIFDENRLDLAEAIESDFGPSDVESVDAFTFDPDTTTIRLAVTSAYNGQEIRRDVAWALTRATALLYGPDGLGGSTGVYPTFDLSVGPGATYTCSGDFMQQLVARTVTRDDWQSSCG